MTAWPGDDLSETIRDLVRLRLPDHPENPDLNSDRLELEDELLGDARSLLEHELAERADAIDAADVDLVERGVDQVHGGEVDEVPDEQLVGTYGLAARLLVDQLGVLAGRRARLNEEITLMLAYAREFVEEPPSLAQLASVVGMSVSGVRTAFGEGERAIVAQRLGRPPLRGRLAPLWRGESSPRGVLLGVDETGSWVSVALADVPALMLDAVQTPTTTGLLEVIRAQVGAAGWSVHRLPAADLLPPGHGGGPLPDVVVAATAGEATSVLLEVVEGDPAGESSPARPVADYTQLAAALARSPQIHLLWATTRPEIHAAFAGHPILRSPARRHEQFWTLEVSGRPPQRVRPARIDPASR